MQPPTLVAELAVAELARAWPAPPFAQAAELTTVWSPLFAFWPFAHAAMLFWAGAAAIPILIHLWSRRKYREVTWAAMEFLLAALRKNARRIRVEQLILLAVRTLILLLLALALADPLMSLLPAMVAGPTRSGASHVVLVIDASYSMATRDDDQTRFARSQQLAAQMVRESVQGDGFTLVLMADPPRVIIGEPAFDPGDVIEEIESLRVRHTGANLPSTVAEVERILQKAAEQHPRLTQATVCFFTDLGRTTWDDVLAPDIQQQIGRLGERASLTLFDMAKADGDNLAVTRLDSSESLVTYGRPVRFTAEVRRFSGRETGPRDVKWLVDGEVVEQQSVSVPTEGTATVNLTHRFDTPGEHVVEVRLADDALDVDNHRWLSVPVRESIRVLSVRGKPGAGRHVALALEPHRTDRARVRVDERPESALLEADLNDYDCVVLDNVGRFGRDEARVLHQYLKNGGGLITFLGDNVQPDSYNEQLGASAELGQVDGHRVLPARIDQLMTNGPFLFDPRDYRHPIIEPFAGHPRSGLLTTPVWRYYQLQPYESDAARVALAFTSGDPAIVDEVLERGRSLLVATAASPDSVDQSVAPPQIWTAWATWPSFPPMMQEMLSLAVQSGMQNRNVTVGEPLEGAVHSTVANVPLTVVAPDGRGQRVPLEIDGEDSRWSHDDTSLSGVYRAEYGPPLSTTQLFTVNVDTRESQAERFDAELLPSQFRQDLRAADSQPSFPTSRDAGLFRVLLFAVLGLLLTESVLAWRFGRTA